MQLRATAALPCSALFFSRFGDPWGFDTGCRELRDLRCCAIEGWMLSSGASETTVLSRPIRKTPKPRSFLDPKKPSHAQDQPPSSGPGAANGACMTAPKNSTMQLQIGTRSSLSNTTTFFAEDPASRECKSRSPVFVPGLEAQAFRLSDPSRQEQQGSGFLDWRRGPSKQLIPENSISEKFNLSSGTSSTTFAGSINPGAISSSHH